VTASAVLSLAGIVIFGCTWLTFEFVRRLELFFCAEMLPAKKKTQKADRLRQKVFAIARRPQKLLLKIEFVFIIFLFSETVLLVKSRRFFGIF
jgi:hypothetical protein